ncbi:MAG: carbohydrate ABC transporter permease [Deltaproteobacteria bacterium]|nr:carbohydrate ABC transporter permease [Deltaproteobacteria bacterium]MBW2122718.1 carbohydrate ABC transporter permease [Deltaproteobacteria bacterium]
MKSRKRVLAFVFVMVMSAVAFFWSTPFIWMMITSFRPKLYGGLDMASLWPDFSPSLINFKLAWESAPFLIYYMNTVIVVLGILIVQLVTVSFSGYVFARLTFPFKNTLFYLFLLQLMIVPPILIVPNLSTLVKLGLYDTLLGIMAPYFASAFGTFLMRQTFKTIPADFEEAAIIDGASFFQVLWHVLLPLARPALTAFGIVSVVYHWNEYLWPLMVTSSPSTRTLTIGLASFTQAAEGASEWGVIAAGTVIVILPLGVAFIAFQKQFVNSFMFSGIK